MLKPIVHPAEARAAFESLKAILTHDSVSTEQLFGWQGGGGVYHAHFHPSESIWSVLEPKVALTRFWCCFGLGNPSMAANRTIVCEINPPREGFDRRMGGIFTRSENGRVFLCHTGKVGGGRKEIGKNAFLDFSKNLMQETVAWPDGYESIALVAGPVDSVELISNVAAFVRHVDQFKKLVIAGNTDLSSTEADHEF